MEWTNDKVISLIELYHNRPVLWDCRLKEYKDCNKRHDALMEIVVSSTLETGRYSKPLFVWFMMHSVDNALRDALREV